MKVSLNWIKDYVDLPRDMDLTRLAYDLTMSTVEVEGATDLARQFDHMLVGRITEVCPHPNADKLQICRTDIGGGDIRDIVCGGTNVRPGMKVAVAAPGAMCRWHGEGEPVEIKEAKLRGVKSYGMICGAVEIGLGDLFPTTEEAHILDLSAFDAPAGTPIADALDLHDIILEIDNKSMTNRPDLWGHYGIARELAALYDLPLKPLPPFTCGAGSDGLTVTVEDTERCPRYIGAAVEGLSVKPAPFRMQSRIWRVGMRPINALVDITNYVMLATGQPTHAFDSDNIAGHIIVRRAQNGEKLELLNGKELALSADDLDTQVVEVVKAAKKLVDLIGADFIVSVGRGISKDVEGGIKLAEELAEVLGGVVGSSRACVDAGWISADHQVGQTGKTVHPKVYVALGISGSIQHKAGMSESECIIAVNKNDTAPIFEIADYGICGDLFKVTPMLIEAIKAAKAAK